MPIRDWHQLLFSVKFCMGARYLKAMHGTVRKIKSKVTMTTTYLQSLKCKSSGKHFSKLQLHLHTNLLICPSHLEPSNLQQNWSRNLWEKVLIFEESFSFLKLGTYLLTYLLTSRLSNRYDTTQHHTTRHNTIWHDTTRHNTTQKDTKWNNIFC